MKIEPVNRNLCGKYSIASFSLKKQISFSAENKDIYRSANNSEIETKQKDSLFKKKVSELSEILKNVLGIKKEKTPGIPPKVFATPVTESEYIETRYVGKKSGIKYAEQKESDYAKIRQEFNPEELQIIPDVKDCFYISNFSYPYGSISITSPVKETLATSGLWQCAATAFVDKKHNMQTLLHFAPGVNEPDNKALLRYILDKYNPEDTRITIVPGSEEETSDTVAYLTDTIKDASDKYNIGFMNFPDNKHKVLALKDGKLSCCENFKTEKDKTNPLKLISYATTKVKPGLN